MIARVHLSLYVLTLSLTNISAGNMVLVQCYVCLNKRCKYRIQFHYFCLNNKAYIFPNSQVIARYVTASLSVTWIAFVYQGKTRLNHIAGCINHLTASLTKTYARNENVTTTSHLKPRRAVLNEVSYLEHNGAKNEPTSSMQQCKLAEKLVRRDCFRKLPVWVTLTLLNLLSVIFCSPSTSSGVISGLFNKSSSVVYGTPASQPCFTFISKCDIFTTHELQSPLWQGPFVCLTSAVCVLRPGYLTQALYWYKNSAFTSPSQSVCQPVY